MRTLFFLLLFGFLISACSTGNKFTSRKYTSGRYLSVAKQKDKVDKLTSKKEAKAESVMQKETSVFHSGPETAIAIQSVVIINAPYDKSADVKLPRFIEKTQNFLEKNKAFLELQKKIETKPASDQKPSSEGSSHTSLLSVFLGAGGLTLEVVGFVLTIVSLEYVFLTMIALGLVLGIVALVMGLKGIKQYKLDKRNGEKKRSTLILGIVGTALGGAAIFGALYFSLLSLIIAESGF